GSYTHLPPLVCNNRCSSPSNTKQVNTAVVGYIQVNEIKNIYSATSTMIVGLPEKQVVDIESVMSRQRTGADAKGEVEILRSRGLAAKVINRLGLLS
ncbi:unnamed protein product, partial [marine sediment metagenome]